MVNRTRLLTFEQLQRQRILSATRTTRRSLARTRGNPQFGIPITYVPVEETVHNVVDGHCTNINSPTLHENENVHVEEYTLRHCTLHHDVTFNNTEAMEMQGEENSDRGHMFSFTVGDANHIQEHCLSISNHATTTINTSMYHPSTFSLVHGFCKLHFLGDISYVCQSCNARLWKSECVRSRDGFQGKHCCSKGKVRLLSLEAPPQALYELFIGTNTESREFRKRIRAYNAALAFVSLGAHIDDRFSRGAGVYTFRIHGTMYHRVGSLLPHGEGGNTPRFAQLYVYDTDNELLNRLQLFSGLHANVMERLQRMMHEHNPYVSVLKSIHEMLQTDPCMDLKMVICEKRSTSRQYIVPVASEVAAIMPGQGNNNDVGHRDIQFSTRDGFIKKISNLHRAYMPLLYVLLFPKGEDGWHAHIPLHDCGRERFVTQRQYYAYRLQIRSDTIACLLRGGRLLQQLIVDAYSSVEESRLLWIRNNQSTLRSEIYQGLVDMVNVHADRDDGHMSGIGRRVVLPSSFTGGPRFMHQLYQDSMSIVRKKGKPDLFITFTCNPNWIEITDALLPGQTAQDRPDLTTRVFYQKQKDLMNVLIKRAIFGTVVGYVYVIEFQKRGLPHAHILLILEGEHKPTSYGDYDKLVCAELPDKNAFPDLYKIITQSNIHGPCGPMNMHAPCMIDGSCKHHYPRNFSDTTICDESGYPVYMRRDNGAHVELKGNKLDCRWVVPYNPFLSLRYKAHINVEVCSTATAVKYLYKYVFKGHDRATVQMLDAGGVADEISSYLDARYVSASEACWRIFEYDMHEEKPDIQRLQVHLPNQNEVMFRDDDDLHQFINQDQHRKTTLTEWFTANEMYPDANDLLYMDFPCHWVWNKSRRTWTRRQKGNTIGRMYSVSPLAGEQYFLRLLLTVCRGCKSFEDLRSVNGQLYPTFKSACLARGLLESDEEWISCLQEAAFLKTGYQLRQLFVVILIFCEPVQPGVLWDRFCLELSDDFTHSLQQNHSDLGARERLAKNSALLHIQSLLRQHGKQLSDFQGMPVPYDCNNLRTHNVLLLEEQTFDIEQQQALAFQMERSLNSSQRVAYDRVMSAVQTNTSAVFFLDGPGGSGKTYLYNTILAQLRGASQIVLASASSGIASLLLTNGRTAHSRFKIPLVLHESSTCNIKVNSHIAELLRLATLLIWDEAPMTHRHAFEALDRTLQDVMQNTTVFGGKVMLFGGDFRQILPVVRKGVRADIVDATFCRSHIWDHVHLLELTQNMRIVNSDISTAEGEFCKWVLDIGNGIIADRVQLPQTMVLENGSLQKLIEWVYPNLQTIHAFPEFFRNRAILAPHN